MLFHVSTLAYSHRNSKSNILAYFSTLAERISMQLTKQTNHIETDTVLTITIYLQCQRLVTGPIIITIGWKFYGPSRLSINLSWNIYCIEYMH